MAFSANYDFSFQTSPHGMWKANLHTWWGKVWDIKSSSRLILQTSYNPVWSTNCFLALLNSWQHSIPIEIEKTGLKRMDILVLGARAQEFLSHPLHIGEAWFFMIILYYDYPFSRLSHLIIILSFDYHILELSFLMAIISYIYNIMKILLFLYILYQSYLISHDHHILLSTGASHYLTWKNCLHLLSVVYQTMSGLYYTLEHCYNILPTFLTTLCSLLLQHCATIVPSITIHHYYVFPP